MGGPDDEEAAETVPGEELASSDALTEQRRQQHEQRMWQQQVQQYQQQQLQQALLAYLQQSQHDVQQHAQEAAEWRLRAQAAEGRLHALAPLVRVTCATSEKILDRLAQATSLADLSDLSRMAFEVRTTMMSAEEKMAGMTTTSGGSKGSTLPKIGPGFATGGRGGGGGGGGGVQGSRTDRFSDAHSIYKTAALKTPGVGEYEAAAAIDKLKGGSFSESSSRGNSAFRSRQPQQPRPRAVPREPTASHRPAARVPQGRTSTQTPPSRGAGAGSPGRPRDRNGAAAAAAHRDFAPSLTPYPSSFSGYQMVPWPSAFHQPVASWITGPAHGQFLPAPR